MGELVHSSMSESNPIPQYFIQSIGEDFLEDYLRQYDDVFLMRFKSKAQEELLAQTGGVGDQIRSVLLAMIEGRVRKDRRPTDRASQFASGEEIQVAIARMSEFGVPDDYFLRQVIQLLSLERSTRVFEDLDNLLKDRSPALDQPFGAPCSLTLSGLAVRKNGALHFSSQLMRKDRNPLFDSQQDGAISRSGGPDLGKPFQSSKSRSLAHLGMFLFLRVPFAPPLLNSTGKPRSGEKPYGNFSRLYAKNSWGSPR